MTRAEQQVHDAMTASSAITAVVGTKIYPDQGAEASSIPLIVYERTATEVITTVHDGQPVASKVTMVVSIWAGTRLTAEQVGDAVETSVRAFARTTNRFSHLDEETQAYASVVELEVWEV